MTEIPQDDDIDSPIIDLHSDQFMMSQALRQAQHAYLAEEVPIGAVIVHNGSIIARASNQVETLKDATAHAEMLALTQAQSAMGDWRLTDCDLYVRALPDVCRRNCSLPNSTGHFWMRRRQRRGVWWAAEFAATTNVESSR
jgi:hypothetical protein